MSRDVPVRWDQGLVTGVVEGEGPVGVLLAHGAGTDQHHASITALRTGLAAGGHTVMSFNYPYTERGSSSPDRHEVLLAAHRAAADTLAAITGSLFLAGRSMGGRIATHLAADDYPVAGVILYAYPLHPAGKPERLRVVHLGSVRVPMLFLQGTKDALSRMDLFDEHIRPLPNARVEILEGAGHGFRGGGWDLESITERYLSGTLTFIDATRSGENA